MENIFPIINRLLAKLGTVALALAPFDGAKAPLPTSFARTLLFYKYIAIS